MLMLLAGAAAIAQERALVAVPSTPTVHQADERLAALGANASLGEEEKKEPAAIYAEARELLVEAQADIEAAAALGDRASVSSSELPEPSGADRADARQAELSRWSALPLDQLQAELAAARADRDRLEAQAQQLTAELEQLSGAPRNLRAAYVEATQALQQHLDTLASPTPGTDPLSRAREFLHRAKHRALAARAEKLRVEQSTLSARTDLANAQRDAALRALDQARAGVEALESLVATRRREEAAAVQREAMRVETETVGKHARVQRAAERNSELARELADIIARQNAATARQGQIAATSGRLGEDFKIAQQRMQLAGLSAVLGSVLREQRRALPDVRRVRRELSDRQRDISSAGLAMIRVEEALRELSDPAARAAEIARDVVAAGDGESVGALAAELTTLLTERRDLYAKLRTAYQDLFRVLGDLEYEEQRLIQGAEQFASFLDRHLLWTPSAKPIDGSEVAMLPSALRWLLGPERLYALWRAFSAQVLFHPLVLIAVLALLATLVLVRTVVLPRMADSADRVEQVATDRFALTVETLVGAALLAAPLPALAMLVAWRLGAAGASGEYVDAVASGIHATVLPAFLLLLFYWLYAPRGLARAHFQWRERVAVRMRRILRLLTLVVIPCAFLIGATEAQSDLAVQASLGRVAFVIQMFALAVTMHALFQPRRGILAEYLSREPASWLARLRSVWYAGAVSIPVSIALLAMAGYYYTALRLNVHQVQTLRLIVLAVLVYHLVLRALLVAERKLAIKRAREERDAAREARHADEPVPSDAASLSLEQSAIDLEAINAQTRRLARNVIGWSVVVALYVVWSDVFPALRVLDAVELWNSSVVIEGKEVIAPVTLTDIAFALVLGLIAAVAARNLPGVLEIAILQRLPLQPGAGYAITTIVQYLIVALGLALIFKTVGVHWENVQWLVAALGVGLGFGLQEIFANFISGLIILFERPVRIGDTVTLGELTGTVSRIHIRATTVIDWDRKEIIIPNKSFITERLINWTLTDPITRVRIPVGIAYGSDTRLAYEVLGKQAEANPRVLPEPHYQVFFLGFGDSALNFELRVFVQGLGDLIAVTHELHMAIDQAFREHGIEIAFPQRDLHLRSSVPLEIRPAGDGEKDADLDAKPT